MVQASVAPYPGAPAGYPPSAAQVQASTDGLSMAVTSVKADPLAQMKNDAVTAAAAAAAAAAGNNTGANNTNSAATTTAAAQMYLQQKKVGGNTFNSFFYLN